MKHQNNSLKSAVKLQKKRNLIQAENAYLHILKDDSYNIVALKNLGEIYLNSNKLSEAIIYLKRAAESPKADAEAQLNYIKTLLKNKDTEQALEFLHKLEKKYQGFYWFNYIYGLTLSQTEQYPEAIEKYTKAIALNVNLTEIYLHRAVAYSKTNQPRSALEDLNHAIGLRPNDAQLYYQRAVILFDNNQFSESADDFLKALIIHPYSAIYNEWLGHSFKRLGRYGRAKEAYQRAFMNDPTRPFIMSMMIQMMAFACDWTNYSENRVFLTELIFKQQSIEYPFIFLNISDSGTHQLMCARFYYAHQFNRSKPRPEFPSSAHNKIRIAYVSADFYNHATVLLAGKLFSFHNRDEFEVIGISLRTVTNDSCTERLRLDFDAYYEVADLSDQKAADFIKRLKIDILIDLKGYTQDSRFGIFTHYPAPVQVSYLGYPGSLGSDSIDYIIADSVLIPPEFEIFYSEKAVRLPGSYQINNRQREIVNRLDSKSDHFLPDQGFIFCCFNHNYKITPIIFDIWMRLLEQVAGSVLWLLADNEEAIANLKKEAAARHVNPERLIFGKKLPIHLHLARHVHADLFLDTLPCNAHTTASDALWAGLPVLSCPGETFASRVAASLLKAAGLPELICPDLAAYEALALRLATEPSLLTLFKDRLQANRMQCDLFNTKKTTRHLETAYRTMHERRQKGLAPEPIDL